MAGSVACALCLGSAAMLALQGCGGGGSSPTPTPASPTPAPTPAPPTTTTKATTSWTTYTVTKGPEGFFYCEDLATFYRSFFIPNTTNQKGGAGQCKPSISPGAYYTTHGDVGLDGKSDKVWSCWNDQTESRLKTDAEAKKAGFAGACVFKDYGSTAKPSDLKHCSEVMSHHPAVCTPGPSSYWGACYSSKTENWLCIPNNDTINIEGFTKGDCKAQVPVIQGTANPEPYFYEGACTFAEDRTPFYKCETVPGYDPELSSTCGQSLEGSTYDKACFATNDDVVWVCFEKGTEFPRPCDWRLQNDGKTFYTAGCYFKGNKNYKDALVYNKSTVVTVV